MNKEKLRVSVKLDTLDLQERLTALIHANVITKDRFGNILHLLKGDCFRLREYIVPGDVSSTEGTGDIAEVVFKVEVDGFVDAIAAAIRAGDIEGYDVAHS
ncbi:hypothetical protein R5S71_004835 [Salmonella enterica]|nr:hypothetical protein [Salmonella enterica subsp. enterica serovar Duisburg]EAQ9999299.1 hypothetical protein [Salmonella enterica]EKB3331608.1 hypothetical protein [Salmonella enterica subsp. enterica serovar Chandans]EAS5079818.1 hypothetical protein [Salmonella enterica]EAU9597438.1 hypothetical protein [Salmonella enterica]